MRIWIRNGIRIEKIIRIKIELKIRITAGESLGYDMTLEKNKLNEITK